MKKTRSILIVFLALALCLTGTLAVINAADEAALKVSYAEKYNNAANSTNVKETVEAGAKGSLTVRLSAVASAKQYHTADGTAHDSVLFGYFDEDGNVYRPGEAATIAKDVVLYEMFGLEVAEFADIAPYAGDDAYRTVQLQNDITYSFDEGKGLVLADAEDSILVIDLNGHSLTVETNGADLFSGARSGLVIVGKGSVNWTEKKDGANSAFFKTGVKGEGDGAQRILIGKGVTVNAGDQTLFNFDGDPMAIAASMHDGVAPVPARLFGTINAGNLATIKDVVYPADSVDFKDPDPFTNVLKGMTPVAGGNGFHTEGLGALTNGSYADGKTSGKGNGATLDFTFEEGKNISEVIVYGRKGWSNGAFEVLVQYVKDGEWTSVGTVTHTASEVLPSSVKGFTGPIFGLRFNQTNGGNGGYYVDEIEALVSNKVEAPKNILGADYTIPEGGFWGNVGEALDGNYTAAVLCAKADGTIVEFLYPEGLNATRVAITSHMPYGGTGSYEVLVQKEVDGEWTSAGSVSTSAAAPETKFVDGISGPIYGLRLKQTAGGSGSYFLDEVEAFNMGSGTKEDPIIIATADDFFAFAQNIENGGSDEGKAYGKGLYFKQIADIDMDGYPEYAGTVAGGNGKRFFGGFYDGCGYTLNVNIVRNSGDCSVFPYLANGSWIANVRITGYIEGADSAQPIRTINAGAGAYNCIFEAELKGSKVHGIAYSDYQYNYNIYTACILNGGTNYTDTETTKTSTKAGNIYYNVVDKSGKGLKGSALSGVAATDFNAMLEAFAAYEEFTGTELVPMVGVALNPNVYKVYGGGKFNVSGEPFVCENEKALFGAELTEGVYNFNPGDYIDPDYYAAKEEAGLYTVSFTDPKYYNITLYKRFNWDNEAGNSFVTAKNGSLKLPETQYSSAGTFKIADGTPVDKVFYGWFDLNGNVYEPGETVFFEKDTVLFEIFGIGVNTYNDIFKGNSQGEYRVVTLTDDIEGSGQISMPDNGVLVINLNGHTINATTNNQNLFNQQRAGLIIVGEGEINWTEQNSGADTAFFRTNYHGYNEGNERFVLGQHVTVDANNRPIAWLASDFTKTPAAGSWAEPFPVYIGGTLSCGSVIRVNKMAKDDPYVIHVENADITIADGKSAFRYDATEGNYVAKIVNSNFVLGEGSAFVESNKEELITIDIKSASFNFDPINLIDEEKQEITEVAGTYYVSDIGEGPKFFSVSYYRKDELKDTVITNADGSITLRTDKYSGDETMKNGNKEDVNKVFFGWYSDDGMVYEPGATVTLTRDTKLYEAYGLEATTGLDIYPDYGTVQNQYRFVRLMNDLVLNGQQGVPDGGLLTIDLNGHNITINTDNNAACHEQRSGLVLVGKGTITQNEKNSWSDRPFYNTSRHGWGDGKQRLIIGRDVTVIANVNGPLYNIGGEADLLEFELPLEIWGTVSAKSLIRFDGSANVVNVNVHEGAKVTVSGNLVEYPNGTKGTINVNVEAGAMVDFGDNAKFCADDKAAYVKLNLAIDSSYNFDPTAYIDTVLYKAVEEDGRFIIKDLGHIHTIVDVPGQLPTCTEPGWTAGKKCEECGAIIEGVQDLEPLGHDLEDHDGDPATCEEGGYDAYQTCKREGCEYSTYKWVDALGHNYVYTILVEATPDQDGTAGFRCSRCTQKDPARDDFAIPYLEVTPKVTYYVPGDAIVGYLNDKGAIAGVSKKDTVEAVGGILILRDQPYSTTAGRKLLGWYDEQGKFYQPGEQIMVRQDMVLYEAYGIDAADANALQKVASLWDCIFVRLTDDIDVTGQINAGNTCNYVIVLNGHTLTVTTDNKSVMDNQRSGFGIIGEGKFEHIETNANPSANNACLFSTSRHGYGDGRQGIFIGADSEIIEPGALFYTGDLTQNAGLPRIYVYGKVNAGSIMGAAGVANAQIIVNGDVTINKAVVFDTKDGSTINLSILGGTFNLADGACFIDSEMASKLNAKVSGYVFSNVSLEAYIDKTVDGEFYFDGIYHIVPLNHAEVLEDVAKVDPSCTVPGHEAGKRCAVCGVATEGCEPIAATGHTPVQHDAQDPTCAEAGWEAYETCEVCDYTTFKEIAPLGHDVRTHGKKDPDCTNVGWEAYEDCSRCNYSTYVEIAALGHDYVEVAAVPATCLEGGLAAGSKCSRCGEIGLAQAPTDPLGHSWSEWIPQREQTCTEDGIQRRVCVRCAVFEDSSEGLEAIGHVMKQEVVEPTCEEEGYTRVWCENCDLCDDIIDEVDELGHDYQMVVLKEATEEEDGEQAAICSICGAERKGSREVIPQINTSPFADGFSFQALLNWLIDLINQLLAKLPIDLQISPLE